MNRRPQQTQGVRLQKLLSQAGVTSRRKAEELILAGKVRVNGQVVTELGTRADPQRDRISVDGRPLQLAQTLAYIALYKPIGVVTTLSDPEGRPTIRDLLRRVRTRVYPIGRLDYTSSGLLLLTNDGELAMRLMHPRYGIEREYRVKVKGVPDAAALERLRHGVKIDRDRRPAKAQVSVERVQDGKCWLRVVIGEGRKHEVRRLCDAVGLSVEKLRRVRIGPLELGKLQAGEYRNLTEREVTALRRAAGLIVEEPPPPHRTRPSPRPTHGRRPVKAHSPKQSRRTK